jgi:hypothetical protein
VSEETVATFPVGARVLVAADADDVWFGGEVEGTVVEADAVRPQTSYVEERRVNVLAPDVQFGGMLTQYVRPEDLTLITSDN